MKIGVWINEDINQELGGGFSYVDRLITLIDERSFDKNLEIVFVSRKLLKLKYNKKVLFLKSQASFKTPLLLKFSIWFFNKIKILKPFSNKIKKNINSKINIQEKLELNSHGIDVIYYLSQTEQHIVDFPFISTNWDIGHISMYAFPEVNKLPDFNIRNEWYEKTIKQALSIFVESQSGKKEIIDYLKINPSRIKIVPIFSGSVTKLNISINLQNEILAKYNLVKEQFFFYPAQFWAHKNHYNLIKSFKRIANKNKTIKLVLTGSDKGNLDYILKLIKKENLISQVSYLGFVELKDIYTFYKNATALVIPTFLGPTNMPLLEARELNCPIVCSDLDGHREQLEEGAIYFNPLKTEEIHKALHQITNVKFRKDLLNIAKNKKRNSNFNEKYSIDLLEENLIEISHYRNCWSNH